MTKPTPRSAVGHAGRNLQTAKAGCREPLISKDLLAEPNLARIYPFWNAWISIHFFATASPAEQQHLLHVTLEPFRAKRQASCPGLPGESVDQGVAATGDRLRPDSFLIAEILDEEVLRQQTDLTKNSRSMDLRYFAAGYCNWQSCYRLDGLKVPTVGTIA
jgi:hypothetical protein